MASIIYLTLPLRPSTGVFLRQWSALPPKPCTSIMAGPSVPDCWYRIVYPSHSQYFSVTATLPGGAGRVDAGGAVTAAEAAAAARRAGARAAEEIVGKGAALPLAGCFLTGRWLLPGAAAARGAVTAEATAADILPAMRRCGEAE